MQDDYNSEFSGEQIDALLKKARDAELYAQRAERALKGVEDIASAANEMLKRITINADSIGMQKINFLALKDEHIIEGAAARYEEDAETGKIIITPMDGESENYFDYDNKYGEDEDSEDLLVKGVYLEPGEYFFKKSITSNRNYQNQAEITIRMYIDGIAVNPTKPFTITETSEVTVEFWIRVFHGHFRDIDIQIDIMPFLCRKILSDCPIEPYKPDLQTQINELREMIETKGGYNETQVESISDSVTEVQV